jgi:formate dehydrogenase major subunit
MGRRQNRDFTKQVRLTEPMVRENGELRAATWEEALGRAVAGFARARESDPLRSFGVFSCSKASNEMNYAAAKFTRAVMRTNNIDSCNRT